jgi:YVTN family beta-propeller protein
MDSNNSNGSRAAWTRGFVALWAMLAMGLGLMARPAEAAPFAYVLDSTSPGTVYVIDTATHPPSVVATIPVGNGSFGVAVTPDGKHAYVANALSNTISVIRTATNTVVATVALPVGSNPARVAVTPDGKHVYVANEAGNVSVIATATKTVVATIPVGINPSGVAITPDGTRAYVVTDTVSVIDTTSNTVVATVPFPAGSGPNGVAITPDGKHAYVAINASVIFFPIALVSVIRTATNTVVATVPPSGLPSVGGVGIVPPPPGVPFLAFSATALDIAFGAAPNQDSFNLHSQFTLSSIAPGLYPHRDPVTLSVGTFSTTIPPGSFKQPDGSFFFAGVVNGVSLKARITPTATLQYAFHAKATGASLAFSTKPVYVTLIISGDSGATSVTAAISP